MRDASSMMSHSRGILPDCFVRDLSNVSTTLYKGCMNSPKPMAQDAAPEKQKAGAFKDTASYWSVDGIWSPLNHSKALTKALYGNISTKRNASKRRKIESLVDDCINFEIPYIQSARANGLALTQVVEPYTRKPGKESARMSARHIAGSTADAQPCIDRRDPFRDYEQETRPPTDSPQHPDAHGEENTVAEHFASSTYDDAIKISARSRRTDAARSSPFVYKKKSLRPRTNRSIGHEPTSHIPVEPTIVTEQVECAKQCAVVASDIPPAEEQVSVLEPSISAESQTSTAHGDGSRQSISFNTQAMLEEAHAALLATQSTPHRLANSLSVQQTDQTLSNGTSHTVPLPATQAFFDSWSPWSEDKQRISPSKVTSLRITPTRKAGSSSKQRRSLVPQKSCLRFPVTKPSSSRSLPASPKTISDPAGQMFTPIAYNEDTSMTQMIVDYD